MKKIVKQDLIIKDFSATPDFPKIEETIAQYWEDQTVFTQSLAQTQGQDTFVFYDGPPFATGLPHYGHLVASTTKDVFPRFQTMLGKYVPRIWGWDCHGLPIENIVEKELSLSDHQAIENYGVDNFCESCRGKVQLYASEWRKTIKRLGRFVDMDHAYKTMDPEFMEKVWGVFQQLWDKKLIYQDYKSMHLCPRCSTPLSNFEVTQGYKDVTDISVYVKFKLKDSSKLNQTKDVYLIAWTTTPWTLPGNFLLAINPDINYSLFTLPDQDEAVFIAASEALNNVMPDSNYRVLTQIKGQALVGLAYEPLMPYFKNTPNAFKVAAADFVETQEGSGLVHIAPAYGENDFILGKKEGLEIIHHVDMAGKFVDQVTDFAHLPVKPVDNPQSTDIEIIKYLAKNNLLFRKQKIKHPYPHCWRCDSPLLNYSTSSFFVKVTALKDELIKQNQQINWSPAHFKDGRFGKWLEGVRDWAISRNRFWGTPLPLWRSEDGDFICVGSQAELEVLSGQKVTDLHKHVVDKIVIEKNGKKYHRVTEVLDCWFESGSMPYAQENFPADFISEGQDQTRGWFYTLHVLAVALKNQPSFKNVLVNGVVLASDGKKMSKKLKNYPDPQLIFDQYGADALRLYLMTSPIMKAENLNFEEKDVARLRRQVNVILWNVFSFWQSLSISNQPNNSKKTDLHILDQYLNLQTDNLIKNMTAYLAHYDVIRAGKLIINFVDELSTFYLRQSRERLKHDLLGQAVFTKALSTLSLVMAPIVPFISELLYQNLGGKKISVHLESWPKVEHKQVEISKDLLAKIKLTKLIIQSGQAQRKLLGIKVRQPLSRLIIDTIPENQILLKSDEQILELIQSELNVKVIEWQTNAKTDDLAVNYDTVLTPALIAEGEAREIIRAIASARKKAGLKPSDKWEYVVEKIPAGWQIEIESKTNTKLKLLESA